MDGNGNTPAADNSEGNVLRDRPGAEKADTAYVMSIEQLRRLVHLLDGSDISELELKRAEEGMHLVLRKAKATEGASQRVAPAEVSSSIPVVVPEEKKHNVVAPLVGTFHTWARPKGGTLVAVGDRVKVGQLVATIESLNMLNEVEVAVSGRVVEVFVQEGEPVEYGQLLMTIESAEEK